MKLIYILSGLLFWVPAISIAQDSSLNRRDNAAPFGQALPTGPSSAIAIPQISAASSAEDSGPDLYGDQEILARPDLWQPWSFGGAVGGDWQSNAALSSSGAESDYVSRYSAAARYTRKLSDSWYLDLGTAGQLVRYDEFEVLDFDRIDADGGLLWITPPDWHPLLQNWIVSSRVSWYRLSEAGHSSTELFTNTALVSSLIRSFSLHRHHNLLLSLSGEFALESSSSDIQRDEHSAFVAWQAAWSPHWETTVLARAAFYDYERHDDVNLIGSVGVDYLINKNLRIGLYGSWTQNLSSDSNFEYDNTTAGVSFRLQYRF